MKQDNFALGRLLGQREAFNCVAGRCSAADVELMRQIRNEKLYLQKSPDWQTFCVDYLHMSKDTANRLIRCLDQFGPAYFEVAQLTRVSPETYRLIAPSIRDRVLHHDGVAIALIPENARQVAAAIAEVREKAAPRVLPAPKPQPETGAPPEDAIGRLERRCAELLWEIETEVEKREDPARLRAAVCYVRERIDRIEMTI